MPCDQCPHCRARAERADLTLSATTPRSVPGGIDRAFYRDFAATYDLARTRTPQPVKLLLEVNPTLTRDRCGAYLKRARALGLVATPGRSATPDAERVATPAPAAGRWWDALDDDGWAALSEAQLEEIDRAEQEEARRTTSRGRAPVGGGGPIR